MTLYLYQSTYYHSYILRVVVDGKQETPVPSAAVQIVRRIFQPDRKPGCEIISRGQAKFIRTSAPHPKLASNLCRALSAAGFSVYR